MLVDLVTGLIETRSEWSSQIEISAITSLSIDGKATITNDLRDVIELARTRSGPDDPNTMMSRRLHLDRVAHQAGFDLVFLPEAKGIPLTSHVPRVHTCHDLIPLRFPRHYLWPAGAPVAWRWAKELRRFRSAARVVAISNATQHDVVRLLRIPASRIDVVPNGTDLTYWRARADNEPERRSKLGVSTTPYVAFAGYCDYRKNIDGMFGALAAARRQREVELVWMGDLSAEQREHLLARADVHGVKGAVRLLGFVDDSDLRAVIRGAVGLLFLSRLEGFGLPVLEAMAAGCPVIVARDSACDEVAADAAIIVDPDNIGDAAKAILTLLEDPQRRAEMIARGELRATEYSAAICARGYVKSFLCALSQPRSAV